MIIPSWEAGKSRLSFPPLEIDSGTRTWVARLTILIYALLVFEGVLRKWIFPTVHQYIIFIRDPFILWIYFIAWKKAFVRGYPREMKFGLWIAFVSLFLILFQEFSFGQLIIFGYGWRNYFLPLALPFILRETLRERDLNLIIKLSLYLTVPIAFLSVVQSISSPDDPINVGFGGDLGSIFRALPVGLGFYRTQGLFTSILGQVMMIGSCGAMALGVWMLPSQRRPMGYAMLFMSTLSIFAMLGVSGSRTAFVVVFLVVGLTILAGVLWLRRNMALKAVTIPLTLVLCGGFVIMSFFTSQFEALAYRVKALETAQTGVWGFGEVFLRTFQDLAVVSWAFENLPLWGTGLGSATNAGYITGVSTVAVEGEWGRNLVDLGPLLGILFILFRWTLLYRVFKDAIHAVRVTNNPLPLFFAAFISFTLFNGYLTAQNTVSGYGWLFTGFALASSRLELAKAESEAAGKEDLGGAVGGVPAEKRIPCAS